MSRLVLILLISLSLVSFIHCQSTEDPVWQKFLEFAKENGKEFVDEVEQLAAFNTFRNSLALLRNHKRQKAEKGGVNRPTYDIELNKFSVMTVEEAERMSSGTKRPAVDSSDFSQIQSSDISRTLAAPPASVDWVAKGAVNKPTLDGQGPCGSCWAFGANGALEAAIKIRTGVLLDLSEQNLVDCDRNNSGCAGGWPPRVWNTYTRVNKLMIEKEYPYSKVSERCVRSGVCANKLRSSIVVTANFKCVNDTLVKKPYLTQSCTFNPSKTSQKYTTKGTIYVNKDNDPETVGDETILMAHVAVVPVAVVINARPDSFKMYKSGIYNDANCTNGIGYGTHSMLAVGYGYDAALKLRYWKLKNSWGTNWGESGYMRIKMGSNVCGIANWPHRPALNF